MAYNNLATANAVCPKQPNEIEQARQEAMALSEITAKKLEDLVSRLNPVLRQIPQGPCEPKAVSGYSCPLASDIAVLRDRFAALAAKIDDLSCRLGLD